LLAALLAAQVIAQAPPPPASKPADPVKPAANAEVEKALDLFRKQQFPDALEQLKKAGKTNPNLMPPKLQMAQWFLSAGSGQNARGYIEQAIAEDPRHPDGYLFNANVAFNEGRVTDAVLNLLMSQEMVKDARWDADQKKRFTREGLTGLAQCNQARGNYEAAGENILGLLKDDPKNGPMRAKYAEMVFRTGKPEQAMEELKRAVADEPTLDPPDMWMATFYKMKAAAETDPVRAEDDRKKTVFHLQEAGAKNPKNAKCKRAYAEWLMEAGTPDAATLYVKAAAELEQNSRDTNAVRALWHMYKKEYAAAEEILSKMYFDSPNDLFAVGNLALARAESADADKKRKAVELAESLVRQNPKAGLAHAVLGWCQYKAGKLDDADKSFGQALAAGQITFDTAYFMARLFNEKGKFEEAHQLLKGAVSAPHGPFVYRSDAKVLLTEVAKKVPEKKDETKK
jgi:tetratricopeptide (TPR) repeat protein